VVAWSVGSRGRRRVVYRPPSRPRAAAGSTGVILGASGMVSPGLVAVSTSTAPASHRSSAMPYIESMVPTSTATGVRARLPLPARVRRCANSAARGLRQPTLAATTLAATKLRVPALRKLLLQCASKMSAVSCRTVLTAFGKSLAFIVSTDLSCYSALVNSVAIRLFASRVATLHISRESVISPTDPDSFLDVRSLALVHCPRCVFCELRRC
jgi:hypothetical protein